MENTIAQNTKINKGFYKKNFQADRRLAKADVAVLTYLTDLYQKGRQICPKLKTIADAIHMALSTVQRAIKRLVEYGYLTISHRFRTYGQKIGLQNSNLYILNPSPTVTDNNEESQPLQEKTGADYDDTDTFIPVAAEALDPLEKCDNNDEAFDTQTAQDVQECEDKSALTDELPQEIDEAFKKPINYDHNDEVINTNLQPDRKIFPENKPDMAFAPVTPSQEELLVTFVKNVKKAGKKNKLNDKRNVLNIIRRFCEMYVRFIPCPYFLSRLLASAHQNMYPVGGQNASIITAKPRKYHPRP